MSGTTGDAKSRLEGGEILIWGHLNHCLWGDEVVQTWAKDSQNKDGMEVSCPKQE